MPSRPTADKTFVRLSAGLIAFGLVMLLSASGPVGYHKFGDSWYFFKHQMGYGFLPGLVLFLILKRIDYRLYKPFWRHFLVASLVALILVFVPGLTGDWGQAKSWISVFGLSFQPTEMVKLTLMIFLAGWFESLGKDNLVDFKKGFLPFVGVLAVISALVVAQPDLGSLSVIVCSAIIAWFVAGAAWSHLSALSIVGVLGLFLAMKAAPYRAARLMTFLDPEQDPLGMGYQINQAYMAICSGGWIGLGLGHSKQKYLYLPETFGDSIFAVMAEEMGFIITLAFLALLVVFLWRGLKIAERAPDGFGRILVSGIIGWIFCQSVFNIASMLGLMPITGLPLPFVSYGGTAMLVSMAAIGIVANVSSHTDLTTVGRKR